MNSIAKVEKDVYSLFFLQMSGFPGSGKSTLAQRISKLTGAIIIDHDIVKSALLKSLDPDNIDSNAAGVPSEMAFMEWVNKSKKPSDLQCLRVDSGKPIEKYIDEVMLYINK